MALASLASAVLGNVIYYSMMIGRSERMKEYMSANGDMNATIVEYVMVWKLSVCSIRLLLRWDGLREQY